MLLASEAGTITITHSKTNKILVVLHIHKGIPFFLFFFARGKLVVVLGCCEQAVRKATREGPYRNGVRAPFDQRRYWQRVFQIGSLTHASMGTRTASKASNRAAKYHPCFCCLHRFVSNQVSRRRCTVELVASEYSNSKSYCTLLVLLLKRLAPNFF